MNTNETRHRVTQRTFAPRITPLDVERANYSEELPLLPGRRRPNNYQYSPFIIALSVILIVVVIASWLLGFAEKTIESITFGTPRTMQLDAVVGHGDSIDKQTHFIAQNLSGQIYVIEIPAGNPSKTMVLIGPKLFGKSAQLVVPKLRIEDLNNDGKADIVITVDEQAIVYINDGVTFKALAEADIKSKK